MFEVENRVMEIMKENGIDIVATLPCDKAKNLFYLLHLNSSFRCISLNKEEDGVGVCAGVYLAGGKPAIVIQSSGLGNCFNALLSLSSTYKLPLPIIASWRGVYKEKIPAQIPFNKDLPKALQAWDIPYRIIEDADEIDLIDEVIKGAFERSCPFVALISPRVWEGSEGRLEQNFPRRSQKYELRYEKDVKDGELTRYEAIKVITSHLDGEAVVCNIGIPSKELYSIRDRELNFYMLGSYSQATPIGFGIALKTKREVIVLDGDGSLLATSILPALAVERVKNLSIICLDNGTFGSTGNQLTYAYSQVDMELMAISMGIKETYKVHSKEELESVITSLYKKEGPRFIHVIVKPGNANVKEIPLTPEAIKKRFMEAIKE
ncbi:MAG: sulfopyruvate decarboxylase subunit beta [Candidatus Methanospirareceae archaeon]